MSVACTYLNSWLQKKVSATLNIWDVVEINVSAPDSGDDIFSRYVST